MVESELSDGLPFAFELTVDVLFGHDEHLKGGAGTDVAEIVAAAEETFDFDAAGFDVHLEFLNDTVGALQENLTGAVGKEGVDASFGIGDVGEEVQGDVGCFEQVALVVGQVNVDIEGHGEVITFGVDGEVSEGGLAVDGLHGGDVENDTAVSSDGILTG